MKNIKITSIFLFSVITMGIIFYACQKEFDKPASSNSNHTYSSLREGCDYEVTVCNGILVFSDTAEFNDLYNCLTLDLEDHQDAFESQYASLTDDQYDHLCDSVGYDDELPLTDFESNNNFVSYRRHLNVLMDAWLDNTVLDTVNDPDNLDYFDDEVMNALFSQYGMVLIGTDLYVIDSEGELWVIENSTCNDVPSTSQDPSVLGQNANARHAANTNQAEEGCRWYKYEIRYKPFVNDITQVVDSSKELKCKLKYNADITVNPPVATLIKAKVVSIKKKSNGKWKRFRTKLYVQEHGFYDCTNQKTYDEDKGPKRKKQLKVPFWDGQPTRYDFASGDACGLFKAVDYNFTYTYCLSW